MATQAGFTQQLGGTFSRGYHTVQPKDVMSEEEIYSTRLALNAVVSDDLMFLVYQSKPINLQIAVPPTTNYMKNLMYF